MTQVPLAPPPPTKEPIFDRWAYLLWKRLTATGQLLWSGLSFTGSNLTDIETRNHADLQNLNTASYTHLTATQATDLTDAGESTLHYHASDRARANHTGTQSISSLSDLLTLASGTYTPTLTNTTNLSASTAYVSQYLRVGNTVTVSGRIDADPTTTGDVQLGISLPIASDFANSYECGGVASSNVVAGQCAAIVADAANNRAKMQWAAVDITNNAMYFSFTYLVV